MLNKKSRNKPTKYNDQDANIIRRNSFSEKIVRHRLRIFFRWLMGIALMAVIVAVFWIQQKRRVYTDYTVLNTYDRDVSESATNVALGQDILSYSNDGVSCSDTKGNTIWNETYEMQSPIVSVSNSTVAIGDYDGSEVYVLNTEGELGEITTNLPLRALTVSDEGVVAAVLEDSDVTWIYLYSSEGDTLAYFKTTMSQSGYPISVSISPNSTLVMVSYLEADSTTVKSGIAFYNFGDVGQNEVDNYMSGYDYADTVVPYVQFMASDLAFAVADNRLMFYEGSQKPVSKAEVLLDEEVQSVYYNDQYVILVTYDSTGTNEYTMTVYDSNGDIKLQKGFDLEYENIVISGENVYLYGDTECVIYNLLGVEKYAGTLSQDISLLIPGKNITHMTLVDQSTIAQIQLN